MAINASHSNVGMNSVRLTGSGDVQYRNWAYRLDGGTWRSISAGPSTSASITVSGLSANRTYSYQIQAINVVTGLMEISSTGSFTTLNATAPTVTAGVSGIGVTEFTINGTSNYACRNWEYSLNGGAWQSLSTLSGVTEVSKKITGLSEDTTYSVRVRATRTYNGVTGTSSAVSATTTKSQTAPVLTCTISTIGPSSIRLVGTSNVACKDWQFQVGNGEWQDFVEQTSNTWVAQYATGLTLGQTYKFRVRATRTYNGVTGTSPQVSATTLGASTLGLVRTVVTDEVPVSIVFNWTVPIPVNLGYTHTLRVKKGETELFSVHSLTGTSGNKTIDIDSSYRRAMLQAIPNDKSFIGTFELITKDPEGRHLAVSTKTATVTTTAENSAPTFTDWSYEENNAKVASVVGEAGYFVYPLSELKIIADTASPHNYSTLSHYGITIGSTTTTNENQTFTKALSGYSDNLAINVFAEDSRGYRTTIRKYINAKPYSKPQVLEWQARRKDSVGEETSLRVLGTIQDFLENNLLKAQVRTQEVGSAWGAWQTLAELTNKGIVSSGRRGYEYSKADWNILDPEKSYNVQIRYQDAFEEYSSAIQFVIARGIPLVSFRDGMVGINNFNPTCGLDVKGGFKTDEFIGLTEVAYPTLHNDWEPFSTSNYGRPEITRIGNVCFLRGMLKQGIITKSTHIATVPQEFRPVRTHLLTMTAYNNIGTQGQISIGIDGKISVNGNWDLAVSAPYWNLNLFWTLGI